MCIVHIKMIKILFRLFRTEQKKNLFDSNFLVESSIYTKMCRIKF